MSELPEPLVSSETDLRNFDYMPLKVAQLRDSDFEATATDAEFRAAVMLWCASWHQLPASSLPSDDRMLCRLAGLGRDLATWEKVKAVAMDGFILCSDGRSYHPVISELAVTAFEMKKANEKRTNAATKARLEKSKNNVTSDVTGFVTLETIGRDVDVTFEKQQRDVQRNEPRQAHVTSTNRIEENRIEKKESKNIPLPLSETDFELAATAWNDMVDWNFHRQLSKNPNKPPVQIPKIQHLSQSRKIGGLTGWLSMIEIIKQSPHLLGENDRAWHVFFDWVLKPANLTKIMEKTYVRAFGKPQNTDPSRRSGQQFFEDLDDAIERNEHRDIGPEPRHDG
jgi:uncharacterized protein YdaU (DUF1376 family)